MEHHHEVLTELDKPTRELREHIPGVFDAYGALGKAVFTGGALDAKTKELIALAISVSKQCHGCIASHAQGAARSKGDGRGGRRRPRGRYIMNGEPGVVHAPRAYEAFMEFIQQSP